MKTIALLCLLLTGCARFTVEQRDESYDESAIPVRLVVTRIKGTAWFSSAQNIARLKATQTDKTQTVGADAIGQHGATNTVEFMKLMVRMAELMRPTQ